jgi:hypothetical protein
VPVLGSGVALASKSATFECVWPAALDTAQQPFRSPTLAAAMAVILDRGGELARPGRLGLARFEAVQREITKRVGGNPHSTFFVSCPRHWPTRPG